MRQYISACPTELLEQARIDGCREFGIFTRIVLPVISPALASWGAISLIARWNDFILPKIFLRAPDKQTLMVSISLLPVSEGLSTPWPCDHGRCSYCNASSDCGFCGASALRYC